MWERLERGPAVFQRILRITEVARSIRGWIETTERRDEKPTDLRKRCINKLSSPAVHFQGETMRPPYICITRSSCMTLWRRSWNVWMSSCSIELASASVATQIHTVRAGTRVNTQEKTLCECRKYPFPPGILAKICITSSINLRQDLFECQPAKLSCTRTSLCRQKLRRHTRHIALDVFVSCRYSAHSSTGDHAEEWQRC